jgi:hypothetical protein
MWPACVTTLAVLAGAGVMFSAGFAFAAEGSASAEAKVAKKQRKGKPCANKNKTWILCKPRVGIWKGVFTQDTPSGPESHPLEFTVERGRGARGRNSKGTEVEQVVAAVPLWKGDIQYAEYFDPGPDPINNPELGSWQPIPLSECADPTCRPSLEVLDPHWRMSFWGKSTGLFTTGNDGDFVVRGDFLSKNRAKGKLWVFGNSDFTIRTVTWKASWAAKTPPPPPEECPPEKPVNCG